MIKMKDIRKSYIIWEQEIEVLKWIDLEIKEWEFVAIMWPSWSWKSTLMNIIWMLDYPTSWEYILDWTTVEKLDEDEQAKIRWKKIWFVFQSYNLVPRLDVLKQISLPLMYQWESKSKRIKIAKECLDKLWIWDKAKNTPKELSWWQQQRVSIARALSVNPSIILADEPTWALDTKTSSEVMEIFKKLNEEWKTIVMITHEQEIAEHAKRVVHIRDWNIYDE